MNYTRGNDHGIPSASICSRPEDCMKKSVLKANESSVNGRDSRRSNTQVPGTCLEPKEGASIPEGPQVDQENEGEASKTSFGA